MPDIKTKVVKSGTIKTLNGTVKTLDRSVRTGEELKDSTIDKSDSSAPDNAPANVVQAGEMYAGKKSVDAIKKTASVMIRSPYHSYRAVSRSIQTKEKAKASIKTAQQTIKASKSTVKNSLKSIQNSIKTSKNMIKTANTTVKTSASAVKGTAQVAKTSYQAAKATAKVAIQEAKVIAKATVEVIKVAVQVATSVIEEIGAFIAAGGWVAVLAVVIIVLAIILCSCFAVFLTQSSDDNKYAMPTVIRNIDTEYANKISEIISNNPADNVEMTGSRAVWSDVLSVYAVKVNYDESNPQDVATLDDNKITTLSSIFWEMNVISYTTETKKVTVITETDDGNGNIIQTETEEEQSFLYITSTHKTANEMATQYGFNKEKKDALTALLAPENAEMWSAVIYGTFGSSNIADVAHSQIGNIGGEPYWRWYGFNSRVEWCACFVSWCANECGYIDAGIIPKYASCAIGSQWFKDRGLWQNGTYIPKSGDIIFFDWSDENGARDGVPDHTGIVDRVEENYIYTIEGNSSNTCRQNKYPIGSADIFGYGTPAY